MTSRTISGLAAALMFAATATVASAGGFGGGVGGAGGAGFGGVGAMGGIGAFSVPAIPAMSLRNVRGGGGGAAGLGALSGMSNMQFPFPTNDPNHYHEIRLIGSVAVDSSGLRIDQQVVQMTVDGKNIPMSINGDLTSDSLRFDQGDELGQNLYRTILSKRLVVVGDQKLRTQLMTAAGANPANARPILVDGYVYDRTTPYLVLVSVGDAP